MLRRKKSLKDLNIPNNSSGISAPLVLLWHSSALAGSSLPHWKGNCWASSATLSKFLLSKQQASVQEKPSYQHYQLCPQHKQHKHITLQNLSVCMCVNRALLERRREYFQSKHCKDFVSFRMSESRCDPLLILPTYCLLS